MEAVATITINEIITDNGVTIKRKEPLTVPVYKNSSGYYEASDYGQDFLNTLLQAEDIDTLTGNIEDYIGFVWDKYSDLSGSNLTEKEVETKKGINEKYELVGV